MGITQNASALRFLTTAPELGRLTEEAHMMTGSPTASMKEHDDLYMAMCTRQEETLLRLENVIKSSRNPMTYQGKDLTNINTNVVTPTEVQTHVCRQDEIDQQKYVKFVEEHIRKTEVNVWARMKKAQMKM